jgi:hypothetical protein
MTEIEQFNTNGYVNLKGIIPADICNIVTQYALLQEHVFPKKEDGEGQVPNAHSIYSDTLMETLMAHMKPYMEKYTGLDLFPTYSYYRVYRPGMVLERHTDRPSCEVSTTICFGCNYQGVDANYKWSMYVDPTYRHSAETDFISQNKAGNAVPQNPGDIIIYKGCEIGKFKHSFIT